MYLFGLEGSGFIISLGITLLLSGMIMYYCVQRMNSIEQSLVKQGEIIQSCIYKLNNLEIQNLPAINNNTHTDLNNDDNVLQERINVSDDEDDVDSDDDTDDDTDDDENDNVDADDADDADDDHDKDEKNIKLLTLDSNNTQILKESGDIETASESDSSDDNDTINDNNEDSIIASSDITSLDNFQEIELNNNAENTTNSEKKQHNIDNESKKIIEIDEEVNENTNYSKMKVNDLKELAIKKNLVKSNDTNKYKKDDLIQLLQK
jgi:hypothetical protein